jgi:hypothetical protein
VVFRAAVLKPTFSASIRWGQRTDSLLGREFVVPRDWLELGRVSRLGLSPVPGDETMALYTDRITLANKRVLITGGSRGLGAEISQVFADAGADLVITGRDRAGLEQTREVVRALGRKCHCIEADLATVEGAREVGRKALALGHGRHPG